MTNYEIYTLWLCLIVFVLLVILSIVCIHTITKLSLRLIRGGLEDKKIIADYKREKSKKHSKFLKAIDYVICGAVCIIFTIAFVNSLLIRCTENSQWGNLPSYRVVKTGSMAEKHPSNSYLADNDLNDQIQAFDLIRIKKLPLENELNLYDIVVYKVDDMLLVHRIVEIEEPNDAHPDCRHFRLQGDASEYPDRFPVLYEQMQGIYYGERTPFIGSFILFMQSPAGWLCMLLVLITFIVTPMINKKLLKAREERLVIIFEAWKEADVYLQDENLLVKR